MKYTTILGLVLSGLISSTTTFAQTATATAAPAKETVAEVVEQSLSEILGVNCTSGLCMSTPIVVSTVQLDGQFHALSTGLGIGVAYKIESKRFPMAIGASVAPILEFDHVAQQGKFAILTHADLFKGLGVGLGWEAYNVGGPDPGLQPFHRSRLFLFGSFNLLNESK